MNMILAAAQDKHRPLGTEILDYMDDILIALKGATTIEDHHAAVRDVLQVLQNYDLFLKPEKCVWESLRVDYLGLILEKGVTQMDPAKIAGVRDWPTPATVKQVRSFLGFLQFLPCLHMRILPPSQTTQQSHKERHAMDMGR